MDNCTNTKSPVNVIGFGKGEPKKYTCIFCKGYFIKHKGIPIGITKIGEEWIYDDSVSARHCECMLIRQLKKRVSNWVLTN